MSLETAITIPDVPSAEFAFNVTANALHHRWTEHAITFKVVATTISDAIVVAETQWPEYEVVRVAKVGPA